MKHKIKFKVICSTIVAVLTLIAFEKPACAADYSKIDSHALMTPRSAEESIGSLAEYLTRPATSEQEKARAIYRWVTANISYDTEAYFSGNYGSTAADDVLKSRSSICDGYSGLFLELAKAAGLEAVKVTGYAKGYGYKVGDRFTGPTNHAWNAVKLDGAWYLIDSTWGAGSVNGSGTFVRGFDNFYFLTPPEQFISRHLPEDQRWQLLDRPVSKEEYAEMPSLQPAFFRYGFKMLSHPKAVIHADAKLDIAIGAARDVFIVTKLVHEGRELENMTFVRRSKVGYTIGVIMPDKGEYTLSLFARRHSAQGSFDWVVDYLIVAQTGSGGDVSFTKVDQGMYEAGIRPVSHPQATIRIGSQAEIAIAAPDGYLVITSLKKDLSEVENAAFVQREKGGYRISLSVPGEGDYLLSIFAKRTRDKGSYQWAMDYKVVASEGAGDTGGFPETFGAFGEHNVRLFAPMSAKLRSGSTQKFKLRAPSAEAIAVVIGSQWTQLKKTGDVFEGEVSIGSGDISVFVKYPGGGSYSGLLKYGGY